MSTESNSATFFLLSIFNGVYWHWNRNWYLFRGINVVLYLFRWSLKQLKFNFVNNKYLLAFNGILYGARSSINSTELPSQSRSLEPELIVGIYLYLTMSQCEKVSAIFCCRYASASRSVLLMLLCFFVVHLFSALRCVA